MNGIRKFINRFKQSSIIPSLKGSHQIHLSKGVNHLLMLELYSSDKKYFHSDIYNNNQRVSRGSGFFFISLDFYKIDFIQIFVRFKELMFNFLFIPCLEPSIHVHESWDTRKQIFKIIQAFLRFYFLITNHMVFNNPFHVVICILLEKIQVKSKQFSLN